MFQHLAKKAFNMFALSVSHTAVFPPNFSDGILTRFLFSVLTLFQKEFL